MPVASDPVFARRRAGILLHPSSLPEGNLGSGAYRFVDFLAASGLGLWQMLPLGPPHGDGSPYQCTSVNAGNPALLDPRAAFDWGWLGPCPDPCPTEAEVLLDLFERHAPAAARQAFGDFCRAQADWLEDYALYQVLRAEQGERAWIDWPVPLRDRHPAALAEVRERRAGALEAVRFGQFLFFEQWRRLHQYASERDVLLFGDLPIFVAYDSADVWAHPDLFRLDAEGRLEVVAGVPPDYFSATGQRWGNPLYRWERMAETGFDWWVRRFEVQETLFDLIRVDHFRGFEACWEIPATDATAVGGRWVPAPGAELFRILKARLGRLPLVAEDLGTITPEVVALREAFGLPGMKVLQFAFSGGADNPYLSHNHEPLMVVYTGTHDNDTTLGWYQGLDPATRAVVDDYLGRPGEAMPWPLIRAALRSVCRLAVVPMQDVLALGSEHRMNHPGVAEGNWQWRFQWDWLPADLADRLHHLARLYGRATGGA